MIDPDAFLRQEVESASPAKLRWLLIRKAIGLCQAVEQLWSDGRTAEAGQWLLRVREILGELLAGVTDSKNPVSKQVTDLYIFLLSSLSKAEISQNPTELQNVVDVLQIELGTWDLYVQRESQSSNVRFDGSTMPAPLGGVSDYASSEWAGLNVEA